MSVQTSKKIKVTYFALSNPSILFICISTNFYKVKM